MRTSHKTGRTAAIAAIALGAGFTLAACGEDEPVAPPSGETTVPESDGSDTETDSDTTETDTGAESDDTTGTETDSSDTDTDGAETDSSDTGTDGADADPSGDVVSLEVPEGWEDMSDLSNLDATPGIDEGHQYGVQEGTFARNVTVIVYPPSPGAPDDYLERLGANPQIDTSTYEELPPVEIDGQEVVGYNSETDYGQGPVRQEAYGFPIDSGQYVEIVFSDAPDAFDSHQAEFDEILASITIN